jgi:hypothetical protein
MQRIDMRDARHRPIDAVEQVPRLEHRRVERFAVEADQRTGTAELAGDHVEQRPLVRGPGEQELFHRKSALAVEARAADEERVRPGAAAQPCRFEVEEDKRRARGRTAGEQHCIGRALMYPLGQRADGVAPVARVWLHSSLDDQAAGASPERSRGAGLAPLAAEDLRDVGRLKTDVASAFGRT